MGEKMGGERGEHGAVGESGRGGIQEGRAREGAKGRGVGEGIWSRRVEEVWASGAEGPDGAEA